MSAYRGDPVGAAAAPAAAFGGVGDAESTELLLEKTPDVRSGCVLGRDGEDGCEPRRRAGAGILPRVRCTPMAPKRRHGCSCCPSWPAGMMRYQVAFTAASLDEGGAVHICCHSRPLSTITMLRLGIPGSIKHTRRA